MSEANLITSFVFHDNEYLIKMNVLNNYLEIIVTDKQSGEEWQCSYDQAYIENLSHKTGNFKQFDIFITMLKSGLLKTSESITLDLLTYDDLENLRIRKIKSHTSRTLVKQNGNRRYLILIYNVEFDRILYPLPLEYVGLPDPALLQATIKKLEAELCKARDELQNRNSQQDIRQVQALQKRIDDLVAENINLRSDLCELSRGGQSRTQIYTLQSAISHLEKSIENERKTHYKLIEKLRREKICLLREIDRLKYNENILKTQIERTNNYRSPIQNKSRVVNADRSLKTVYRNLPQQHQNSPRRSKSEGCNNKFDATEHPRRKLTKTKPPKKQRSRASSASSCKYSDADHLCYNNNMNLQLSNSKEKSSRRQSSIDRSASSSASSCSVTTSLARPYASHILRRKLKSSEEEFKNLESRISTLQKMLQNNVNV